MLPTCCGHILWKHTTFHAHATRYVHMPPGMCTCHPVCAHATRYVHMPPGMCTCHPLCAHATHYVHMPPVMCTCHPLCTYHMGIMVYDWLNHTRGKAEEYYTFLHLKKLYYNKRKFGMKFTSNASVDNTIIPRCQCVKWQLRQQCVINMKYTSCWNLKIYMKNFIYIFIHKISH